jgi:hypothetical protein
MYPNLGSSTTQPSAPPPPSTLSNSGAPKPVGFSSLMSQQSNQSTPYPGGQSLQTPYPSGQPSQPPYPGGQPGQPPYPTGPPSSSYNNPYSSSNQPPNTGNYSSYSLPQTGQKPTAPSSQG